MQNVKTVFHRVQALTRVRVDRDAPKDDAEKVRGVKAEGTLRSLEAMQQARDTKAGAGGFTLPSTMPKGPWLHPHVGEMKIPADLEAWCRDSRLGGGGWGIAINGNHAPSTKRGQQKIIICRTGQVANDKNASCKWSVTIERCIEGWGIWSYHEHSAGLPYNHELTKSTAEG